MKWERRHTERIDGLFAAARRRWDTIDDRLFLAVMAVAVVGLLVTATLHLTGVLDEPSATGSLEKELREYPASAERVIRIEAGDGEATLYTTHPPTVSGRAEADRLCDLVLASSDDFDRVEIVGRREPGPAGASRRPRLSACAPDESAAGR